MGNSIRKAVITAAGRGTRLFPATHTIQKELIPVVDRDGVAKPVLQIIVEEAIGSGIEEICIVANPGNIEPLRSHFRGLSDRQKTGCFRGKASALKQSDQLDMLEARITFVVQETQEGYGHAVYQTRDWVGDEPFVLLLGDHVYISDGDVPCTQQVIDAYHRFSCCVTAVARTSETVISRFGTVFGTPVSTARPQLYELLGLVEKPGLAYARVHLRVQGLPIDEYLCLFGIYVYTPTLFDCIAETLQNDLRVGGEIQLATAQAALIRRERCVATEIEGVRLDMGVPEGLVETQLALALHSPMRAHVLSLFEKTMVNESRTTDAKG